MLSFHTTIDAKYKIALLKRGTFMATIGLGAMIFASIEIGPSLLSKSGIFIFLFGVFMIGYGLLPYRKLMRLELSPHHLFVDEKGIEYVHNKIIEQIALNEIASMEYYQGTNGYGIKIKKLDGSTIAMPFFSKRTFDRLQDEQDIARN